MRGVARGRASCGDVAARGESACLAPYFVLNVPAVRRGWRFHMLRSAVRCPVRTLMRRCDAMRTPLAAMLLFATAACSRGNDLAGSGGNGGSMSRGASGSGGSGQDGSVSNLGGRGGAGVSSAVAGVGGTTTAGSESRSGTSGGGGSNATNPYRSCASPSDCLTSGSTCDTNLGCLPPCAAGTGDCPTPPEGGTAAAYCMAARCLLDCGFGKTCPDGMRCNQMSLCTAVH
jgi:hypothetical protein